MRMIKACVMIASLLCLAETGAAPWLAPVVAEAAEPNVAVGPQYDSTHVYVAPEDFDRFVSSFIATFGGTTSNQVVTTVTNAEQHDLATGCDAGWNLVGVRI